MVKKIIKEDKVLLYFEKEKMILTEYIDEVKIFELGGGMSKVLSKTTSKPAKIKQTFVFDKGIPKVFKVKKEFIDKWLLF